MYFTLLLSVHIVLCLSLIGLVLIQQGKGADMGAAFGGGSNTLFGASGAVNVITKVTTSVAVLFMLTSILLVRAYSSGGYVSQKVTADPLAGSVMGDIPEKSAQPVKPPEATTSADTAQAPTAAAVAGSALPAGEKPQSESVAQQPKAKPEAASDQVADKTKLPETGAKTK